MTISEERIRARRAALVAQMAEAQQQYDQAEATLRLLGRNLDAMQGGLQELDNLLAEPPDDAGPPAP
jgi:uncharacterized coiled-coil protein SlyX